MRAAKYWMNLKTYIQIVTEGKDSGPKVARDAFLYMDPPPGVTQHAQCGTCMHFMPGKERCNIFPKSFKVVANASCALYINGEPKDDQEFIERPVDPKASGYVLGQVRCENCLYFGTDTTICSLFDDLNKKLPKDFKLDAKVDARGCCNAWREFKG